MIDLSPKTLIQPLAEPKSLSLTERQGLKGAKSLKSSGTTDPAKLKEACNQFEGLMIHQMLKGMRQTINQTGLIGGSNAENMWRDLQDQALSDEAARSGGLGLSDMLYRQLTGADSKSPASAMGNMTAQAYLNAVKAQDGLADLERRELQWPVRGTVTSEFGPRMHPILHQERQHDGLDIAAQAGTPVRAAADGRVVFSGERGGYGQVVELDHGNGLITRYAHNQVNRVEEGQTVRRGQTIALVGSTGLSTGPHVHFEVRQDGQAIDPLAKLRTLPGRKGTKTASKSTPSVASESASQDKG